MEYNIIYNSSRRQFSQWNIKKSFPFFIKCYSIFIAPNTAFYANEQTILHKPQMLILTHFSQFQNRIVMKMILYVSTLPDFRRLRDEWRKKIYVMINNNCWKRNILCCFFSWWNTYVSLICSWERKKRVWFPDLSGIENIRIMDPFSNKCYTDIMAINSLYLVMD